MPGETYDSFLASVEETLAAGGAPVMFPLLLLNNTDYTKESFRADRKIVVRNLPFDVSDPELTGDMVVAHADMTEEDWLRGLEFRLSLHVFQKSLLRCTLRVLAAQTGARLAAFTAPAAILASLREAGGLPPDLALPRGGDAAGWVSAPAKLLEGHHPYPERIRVREPDGRIGHAELQIGDSVVMFADEFPEHGVPGPRSVGGTPVAISVHVADVDEIIRRTSAGS